MLSIEDPSGPGRAEDILQKTQHFPKPLQDNERIKGLQKLQDWRRFYSTRLCSLPMHDSLQRPDLYRTERCDDPWNTLKNKSSRPEAVEAKGGSFCRSAVTEAT